MITDDEIDAWLADPFRYEVVTEPTPIYDALRAEWDATPIHDALVDDMEREAEARLLAEIRYLADKIQRGFRQIEDVKRALDDWQPILGPIDRDSSPPDSALQPAPQSVLPGQTPQSLRDGELVSVDQISATRHADHPPP